MNKRYNSDENNLRKFSGAEYEISTGRLWHNDCPTNSDNTSERLDYLRSMDGYREAIPQLQLSLTYACNMDCSYCSFRERMNQDGRPLNMEMDIADQAIDFFSEHVLPFTRYARIDFGLTGETFLRHKIHQAVRNKIKKRLAETTTKAIWTGPCTTNGTLSRTIGIESEMGPPQDISCDGPKEVHDAVRPYVSGDGTYDDLLPIIREVLERHPDIGVSAVLTSRCTDFDEIFKHLYEELGFRSIYMKPVNLAPSDPDGLNSHTVERFKAGYTRLVDFILSQSDEKILDYLAALDAEDFFMRFFYRVVNQNIQIYRCGAGKSGVYVDTDGLFFPCAHFIGKTGYSIGSVEVGFDETKRQMFKDLTVDSREPCRSCWAKYLCGGGCYYQAVLANGAITKPDEAKCDLIRHLSHLAIRVFNRLAKDKPDILAALPIEPHIPDNSMAFNDSAQYTPVSKLIPKSGASPGNLNLLSRQHIESSLSSSDEFCALEFAGLNGGLQISVDCSKQAPIDKIEFWFVCLNKDLVTYGDLRTVSPSLFGETYLWSGGTILHKRIDIEATPIKTVPYSTPKWQLVNEESVFNSQGDWQIWLNYQKIFGHQSPGNTIGFNLKCHFKDGRKATLIRSEPFCLIDTHCKELLSLSTPQWSDPLERDALNDSAFEGLIPLSHWQGFQANVC